MSKCTKILSWIVIIGQIFFVLWLTLLGFLWENYSPISQMMSEIGAINSPYSNLMQFGGFSLLGLTWTCFSILLYLKLYDNWAKLIGILLIFISSISMFLVGFYPCDAFCENISNTGQMHSLFAIISNLAFVFGMIFIQINLYRTHLKTNTLLIALPEA
jgi:hypothetical membrane protein